MDDHSVRGGSVTPPAGCPAHAHTTATAPVPVHGPEFAFEPERFYGALREQGPAAPVELAPGVEAVLVTEHAAALRVLQDAQNFSRNAGLWDALREGRIPADSPALGMLAPRNNAMFVDGATHRRLRLAVSDSLDRVTPEQVSRDVRQIAEFLIGRVQGYGRCDLLADFAGPLPMLLTNRLFGATPQIGDRLERAMADLFDGSDPMRANTELTECLMELVVLKRRRPAEDVTSWLAQHPSGLTDAELVDQLLLMMGAGVEPVQNLVGNTLLRMLADTEPGGPDTGLLVGEAVNWVLWNQPPIANYAAHYTVRDIALDEDTVLRAGTPILISFAAANADPALEHDRRALSSGAHLAWGAGPHACPAKSLSQQVALAAVEAVFAALPDVALDRPSHTLGYRPGPFQRGLVTLPAVFTPSAGAAAGGQGADGAGAPATSTAAAGAAHHGAPAKEGLFSKLKRWLTA